VRCLHHWKGYLACGSGYSVLSFHGRLVGWWNCWHRSWERLVFRRTTRQRGSKHKYIHWAPSLDIFSKIIFKLYLPSKLICHLFCIDRRCTPLILNSMLYRRGLNHFIITYACTRFPIIQPSMEWTLNTILVDDLTSYSEMCSHVKTVSLKGIYNFIFTFKDNQIVAIDVYRFHRSDLKLISFGNVVPSVWIGRWRFSQIFFWIVSIHPWWGNELCWT